MGASNHPERVLQPYRFSNIIIISLFCSFLGPVTQYQSPLKFANIEILFVARCEPARLDCSYYCPWLLVFFHVMASQSLSNLSFSPKIFSTISLNSVNYARAISSIRLLSVRSFSRSPGCGPRIISGTLSEWRSRPMRISIPE